MASQRIVYLLSDASRATRILERVPERLKNLAAIRNAYYVAHVSPPPLRPVAREHADAVGLDVREQTHVTGLLHPMHMLEQPEANQFRVKRHTPSRRFCLDPRVLTLVGNLEVVDTGMALHIRDAQLPY